MTEQNLDEQSLDEHLDQAASDIAAFDQFQDIDWATLSELEFGMKKEQVFRKMRSLENIRRVAGDVRSIDAEAEARKRRKAEPRDVNVTFRNSG